ncbi:MAG: hypothetical protein V2A73_13965, partial [Pseudomonadota bacterium]
MKKALVLGLAMALIAGAAVAALETARYKKLIDAKIDLGTTGSIQLQGRQTDNEQALYVIFSANATG